MNLDDVLKDPSRSGSLTDHDWWIDGLVKDGELTYDPSENYRDNNKKDDLEIEWGNGTIQPTYSNEEEIPVPSGIVDRNIPPEALGDANPVIMFARDLMNRGVMGSDLQRRIRENFEQGSIKFAANGLRDLFKMEGIIGCIAVDTRGYDSAKEAVEATVNNPYKHFIKYAVTAPRAKEDYLWLPNKNEQRLATDAVTSGNAIDDFFGGEDSPNKSLAYTSDLVAYCKETMLPVLAGQGDLDESEMDDTMTELLNVSGLPEVDLDNIINNGKYASRLDKVQAVFRYMNSSREATAVQKYADSVDASEFVIGTREQEIEIQAEHRVNPLDMGLVGQNQIDGLIALDSDVLKVGGLGASLEFELDDAKAMDAAIDVDIMGNNMEFNLDNEVVAQDVSIAQHEDPHFVGGDFSFDDAPKKHADMEIELGSSMEW